MANYRITGTTYENGSPAQNVVVVYKADKLNPNDLGVELGRTVAAANGTFTVQWSDWGGLVFWLAMDPTDSVKYEAKVGDWIVGELF